ncbi:MAG: AsmA family protein, partial [Alphaproteobacteria bacterium]|nr:AsmA family protein [Alphaproteobacteria bacterium]
EVYLISQITKTESLTSNVSIKSTDLQKSLKNFIKLPKIDDILAKFELILTPKIASIKKLDLTYNNDTNLKGDIDIVLNKKPDIKANLHIPTFDIPKLFYPLWEPAYFERLRTGTEKPSRERKVIENPKAFKDIPLPIKELDWANIILHLTIDELKAMPEMAINNIKLFANINNGSAIIAPFSIDYMGGKVVLDVIANNDNNTFNGDVSIKGTDVNIGDIIASTGYKDIFKGGNTNIDIVLKGVGNNLEEFMKNLNGYTKVYTTSDLIGYRIENLVMANDVISSIFKFVGEDIIGGLAGNDKKEEKSTIECAIVNLNIQDGKTISNRGIAIQTKDANIIIDGTANLGDEYLNVSVITVVKEGFGVSNSLAEMIKIEGPMAKPSIIISKDGVVKNVVKTSLATVVAGIFTGGAILVTAGVGMITKSWLENISADKNPCLTAFEGKSDRKKNKSASQDFGNQVI